MDKSDYSDMGRTNAYRRALRGPQRTAPPVYSLEGAALNFIHRSA